METRDHVVCKDKTLADTDSTFNFKLPCDTWLTSQGEKVIH